MLKVLLLLLIVQIINPAYAVEHDNHALASNPNPIREYAENIDANVTGDFSDLINKMKKDSSTYTYVGKKYSTIEYFVIKLILSKHSINCNRQNFIEQIIEKEIGSFQESTVIAFLNYFKKDWKALEEIKVDLNDSNNRSLFSSLYLTQKVLTKEFSSEYSIFLSQVDSICIEYLLLPNESKDMRLLTPINHLLLIWQGKFPEQFKQDTKQFILSKEWGIFESITLQDFIALISYRVSQCQSKYNIDPRVLSCAYIGAEYDYEFQSEKTALILKDKESSSKKKKCRNKK